MEKHAHATAEVKIMLRVRVDGKWSGACPIDQVHKQVKESAIFELDKLRKNSRFSIIGEPRIVMIIMEDE